MKIGKLLMPALLAPVLMVAACHPDRHEEDEDFYYVNEIPPGGVDFGVFNQFEHDYAELTIDSSSDQDGFPFSLAEDSTIMITVTGVGGFDPFVDLYEWDFDFIAGDDDGGPGADSVLVGQLDAGDYFAVVGGVGSSTGDYAIDIVVGSLGGLDFEVLDSGFHYSDGGGVIDDAWDADSYYFTITSAQVVDIYVTRISGDYDGTLQIVDQFGQEVAFHDPSGDADPGLFSLSLDAGSYLVVVGANAGDGTYGIDIDVH